MKKKLIRFLFHTIQIVNNCLWIKATRNYEETLYINSHFYYRWAIRANKLLNKLRRMY